MASNVLRICFLAAILFSSDAAKILFVPANINSHIVYFSRMAKGLADLGHSTHMLVASNAHVSADILRVNIGGADKVLSKSDATKKEALEAELGGFSMERYHVEGNVSFTSSPLMTEVCFSY